VNWQRAKPWLVMGLIYVVGIITGAALMFGFRSDWSHPPDARQLRSHWLVHLTQRLNLTADQQAKIQPILSQAGDDIQKLHRDEVDRLSQIMAKANDQIATLLTPAQQAELKEMESERERTFDGHMRPWGEGRKHAGPGGPPRGGPSSPEP